jgi:hypothetical protein
MDFLTLFLKSVRVLPDLIQGTELLFGEKSGMQKKAAVLELASSAITLADAAGANQIVDAGKFTAGIGLIIDGVVDCLNASIWASR